MLVAALTLLGIISAFMLNYSIFPIIKNPALSIIVDYPTADAETVENTITIPLEDRISAIGGITEIRSHSEKGKSLIRLDFENNANIDLKTLEIKERIEGTVASFPREVRKPKVLNFDPSEMPIIVISLKVPNRESMGELRVYADTILKKTYEGIEGVSKVTVSGGKLKEILISFDVQKLNAYNLSLTDLHSAIHFNNLSSTVASVEEKGGVYQVRLKGKFSTLKDLTELPITSLELGKTVTLGDIAKISTAYREEDNAYRVNQGENIGLYIYKKHNANLLQVSSDIKNAIDKLNEPDRQTDILFNQADNVRNAYLNVLFIVFITLISLLILLHRKIGRRANALMVIVLFQLLFLFFLYAFIHFIFRIDFDLLSILSIYLSFAIWIFLNETIRAVYDDAKTRINVILFASIGIPLLFLPTSVINSTVAVNLMRLAFLTSFGILINQISYQYIVSNTDVLQNQNVAEITTIPEAFKRVKKIQENIHSEVDLRKSLRLLLLFILTVSTATILYVRSQKEVYFNVEDDRIYGYIELPSDSSFSYTDQIVRNIESKLLKNPKVKDVISQVDPGHAFLIINYHKNWILKDNIISSLNESIGKQNPAYCYFTKESELGRVKEISLDVIGSKHSDLNKTVPEVANRISNLPGIHEVILNFKPPRNELQLDLNNRNSLVQNSEIGSFLRTVLQGSVVSKFSENNGELDIRIRASKEYRESEKQLNRFLIKNNVGQFSPISNLYTQKESVSPIKLFRKNKRPSLSLSIRTDSYDAASLLNLVQNHSKDLLGSSERIELNSRIEKLSKTQSAFITFLILIFSCCLFLLVCFTESIANAWTHFVSVAFAYGIFLSVYLLIFKTYDIGLHIGSVIILLSLMLRTVTKTDPKVNVASWGKDPYLFIVALFFYLPLLLFSNPELAVLRNAIGFFFISLLLSKFFIFPFEINYKEILIFLRKKIVLLGKSFRS
ncbi:efflux RND transporter permease subunit [Leptospira yasudae]|uniref:Efflux RND transporter permease subunit n=2 Tax=Leptospira yasudae TaxID=2202201 RepID=A0A6N4QZE3_9LEPT|nr:efflux RND transporter permease subunit [Leptospira yasudae]TGL83085.1 efflux RND transporter permease subunit [Leptospira yasudae]TGL85684.1 efflux RND transporter permease subunit [Leptospira yasudae]